MPGSGSPYSEQEKIWIVKTFGELKSSTLVRHAFRKKFSKTNPKPIHRKYKFFLNLSANMDPRLIKRA